MNEDKLLTLLQQLQSGEVTPEHVVTALKDVRSQVDGELCLDRHRDLRRGFPEVIYGEHKTSEQLHNAVKIMAQDRDRPVLITRLDEAKAMDLAERFPGFDYEPMARCLYRFGAKRDVGRVAVVSAGTSDLPVAKEAALTARVMGAGVDTFWDIGVAGIHRLFNRLDDLRKCRVAVVVAGMEGALPGVVAGLLDVPVIAVPTSIGYGATFQGLTALLGMLTSCSPGVSVVNIDNGFGAGYLAALINAQSKGDSGSESED